MAKPSRKSTRRQRRHGDLPAGFRWREGRPRWEPSPARRAQGWRGVDLKDAWRNWLAKGAAIERAQAIADAVSAWTNGEAVPSAFVAIAPKGADLAGATSAELNPRSIGTLLDAYYDSPKFKQLGTRTQSDYKSKLGRFLETLAGSEDAKKIEKLKGLDIDVLLPPAFNEPGLFEIERAYDELRETAGVSMAYGVLACVSAWLGWCVKKKRVWPTNPATLVEREVPDGRIEVLDWPELVALVRHAEAAGLPSIADAVILAVDLSWSQQDLLALTEGQISADFHVKHRRIKTGNAGNPQLLKIGQARVAQIRARWADSKIKPTHLIVCELPEVKPGQPWSADTFRHKFAEIRAAAAAELQGASPEPHPLASKQFRDLRDTAITYAYEAGLDIPGICSRTMHSPKHAQAVITKHYGAIRQGIADEAALKLDAHFAAKGYTFDKPLALPAPAKEG